MLKLDDLFQLFEQLEHSEKVLSEQDIVVATEDKILKYIIPKIELTQQTLGNNEILKQFSNKIIGNTLSEKLNGLNIQLTKMGKIDKRGQNLQLLIEKVAILDALRRMFQDFDASPAGFLNEGFISAFFENGVAENTAYTNQNHLIQDVSDGDKKYSVKTLGKSSSIGGSSFNLCNTIWNYGEITYLLFEKKSSDKQVVAYSLREFVINKDNLSSLRTSSGENMADYYKKNEAFFHKPKEENKLKEAEETTIDNVPVDVGTVQTKNPEGAGIEQAQPDPKEIEKAQFVIPRQMFGKATATVNFSTQQALIDIKEMVGEAITQVEELHEKLNILTNSIAQYFITTDRNKKQQMGQKMIDVSAEVKPKTEDIAKK